MMRNLRHLGGETVLSLSEVACHEDAMGRAVASKIERIEGLPWPKTPQNGDLLALLPLHHPGSKNPEDLPAVQDSPLQLGNLQLPTRPINGRSAVNLNLLLQFVRTLVPRAEGSAATELREAILALPPRVASHRPPKIQGIGEAP
jgi:hypothetical protein